MLFQIILCIFAKNCQDEMSISFTERIKELRINSQLPQRKLAAALDIDTATYCKIERGERKARKEQVRQLEMLFHIETDELLTLWLADRVSDIVSEEENVAYGALSIAVEKFKEENGKVKVI